MLQSHILQVLHKLLNIQTHLLDIAIFPREKPLEFKGFIRFELKLEFKFLYLGVELLDVTLMLLFDQLLLLNQVVVLLLVLYCRGDRGS